MVFFGNSLVRVSADEQAVGEQGRATVGEYCRAISCADTWRDAYGNSEHVLRDVFGDAPVDALIAANQNARA